MVMTMKIAKEVNIEKRLEYYDNLPYTVMVEQWDDGSGLYWVARIAELPHCLIHADTPEEAVKEIQEVKRDWIKSNLQRGLKIPEPRPHKYSGQVRLRISPSLHRLLANMSAIEHISLNQYMATALAGWVGLSIDTVRKRVKQASEQEIKPPCLMQDESCFTGDPYTWQLEQLKRAYDPLRFAGDPHARTIEPLKKAYSAYRNVLKHVAHALGRKEDELEDELEDAFSESSEAEQYVPGFGKVTQLRADKKSHTKGAKKK